MDAPDNIVYAQAGFMVAGIVPMMIGVRHGRYTAGFYEPRKFIMPLIWIGLTIWTVGGLFTLAQAIVWFDLLGICLASFTLAVDAFLWYMAFRLQRHSATTDDRPASTHDDEESR